MKNRKYLLPILIFLGLSVFRGNAQVAPVIKDTICATDRIQTDFALDFSTTFNFKNSGRISCPDGSGGLGGVPRMNHLPGMFCKLEYKLETRSKLAPRFRLGSLSYTNWMEGKLPTWNTSGY